MVVFCPVLSTRTPPPATQLITFGLLMVRSIPLPVKSANLSTTPGVCFGGGEEEKKGRKKKRRRRNEETKTQRVRCNRIRCQSGNVSSPTPRLATFFLTLKFHKAFGVAGRQKPPENRPEGHCCALHCIARSATNKNIQRSNLCLEE